MLIMVGHISGTMHTVAFSPIGGTGVALFLIISGYGLNESYKKNGLTRYWQKKVFRVLTPYFIVITILYLVKYEFVWWRYLLEVTGLYTSYWFIAYIVKWYIVYWLFSRFFQKYRSYLMFLAAIIMLFTLPDIEAEQSFSFLAGYLISEKKGSLKNINTRFEIRITVISFLIGTIFLCLKQLPYIRVYEGELIYNIIQVAIKLPYAMTIIALLAIFPKYIKSKFLILTGTISYELYLVHMPFYGYVNGNIWYAFVLLLSAYIIAYIFNILNKKIIKAIA